MVYFGTGNLFPWTGRQPGDNLWGVSLQAVDWKTGAQPVGREAEVRTVQLATYALAFARLRGVDTNRVDAAFFYAAEGVTVRPAVPDERILVAMLSTIPD